MDSLNKVRATVELERNKLAGRAWDSNIPTGESPLEFNQACHPHSSHIDLLSTKHETALFSSVASLLPLVIRPLSLQAPTPAGRLRGGFTVTCITVTKLTERKS